MSNEEYLYKDISNNSLLYQETHEDEIEKDPRAFGEHIVESFGISVKEVHDFIFLYSIDENNIVPSYWNLVCYFNFANAENIRQAYLNVLYYHDADLSDVSSVNKELLLDKTRIGKSRRVSATPTLRQLIRFLDSDDMVFDRCEFYDFPTYKTLVNPK